MNRILFVDDEPRILEALRNLLRRQRRKWAMEFAEGGEEALRALALAPFDVIVSDMRMPGIDGATLLTRVRQDYPRMVRIVLSGHTQLEAAMRAIPFAHQFLTKPCDAEVLQNVVERACDLQTLVGHETVQRVIGAIDKLPPVPGMYAALTHVLTDPNAGAEDVARILEQDMAMCAKLLQLVNSPFFSARVHTADVTTAVLGLGFETIKSLALSLDVFQTHAPPQVDGFCIEALQRHALHAGAIARMMLPDKQRADDAFMAALLHDIGKLVLASELPEQLQKALALAQSEGEPLHAAEQKLYGVTHAEIGGYLLGLWGLPYPVVEAVANHHAPARVSAKEFDVLGAVHVADALAREAHDGPAGAQLDMQYLTAINVAQNLDSWREMSATVRTGF